MRSRAALALALAVTGCVALLPTRLTARSRAVDGCAATADGATLRCGERVLAAVECYGDDGRVAPRSECRALAVRYDDGERAWLYRPRGFDPGHPDRYRRPDKIDFARAYGVVVALDARVVTFFTRTPLTRGEVRRYDVERGVIEDVDREDEWRIWAAIHDGRAVVLGGTAEPPPL